MALSNDPMAVAQRAYDLARQDSGVDLTAPYGRAVALAAPAPANPHARYGDPDMTDAEVDRIWAHLISQPDPAADLPELEATIARVEATEMADVLARELDRIDLAAGQPVPHPTPPAPAALDFSIFGGAADGSDADPGALMTGASPAILRPDRVGGTDLSIYGGFEGDDTPDQVMLNGRPSDALELAVAEEREIDQILGEAGLL